MNYYKENTIIYWNGEFIKAKEAKIDLYSQTMHYGFGVFEGIRSYKTASGQTKIFKQAEHFERLKDSADALSIPYKWTAGELIEATYEVLKKNDLRDAYIRPLIYGPANMSFNKNTESFIAIEAWEMQPFLGNKLLHVMISSFERPNPKAFHINVKACGHYVNSILASQEAKSKGFDEALLNDMNGFIAEGPGANIFMEKNNVLFTPQPGHILPGITRATVLELCEALDIPVVEKQITPEEIHHADSAFFCGTAAEIIGIASIDDKVLNKEWNDSLGCQIQTAYKNLVTEKENVLSETLA